MEQGVCRDKAVLFPATLLGAHQHLFMCHASSLVIGLGCGCIAYCQLR